MNCIFLVCYSHAFMPVRFTNVCYRGLLAVSIARMAAAPSLEVSLARRSRKQTLMLSPNQGGNSSDTYPCHTSTPSQLFSLAVDLADPPSPTAIRANDTLHVEPSSAERGGHKSNGHGRATFLALHRPTLQGTHSRDGQHRRAVALQRLGPGKLRLCGCGRDGRRQRAGG